MYSRLPGFDPCPPHPLPRGWCSPAALRRPNVAALPGGNSFPCLDPGALPWGWLVEGGPLCRGLRWRWICRNFLGCGQIVSVRLSIWLPALAGLFLFQQRLHPAPGLIGPTGGGVLDPVAAIVAGLPMLGGLPELTPQALSSIIQPTADKLLRCSLDFFF